MSLVDREAMHYVVNSIAEYIPETSVMKPTYILTYESATELLYMNLEEKEDLRILQEAASIRAQWRRSQVCVKSVLLSTDLQCIIAQVRLQKAREFIF
jgi:exoribonuclease R